MIIVNKDGARVLVVDDEPNITELVAMALRYEGFNVKTAATGRGALSAVTQFAPSLVILDVMLPDIDGIEVLKRMNSAGNKVPIIFLTAKDATEDKVHGLTIGGDDYVTKPFNIEERFGHIVIAPDRQPVDFVLGGVFGGQENDRHLVARAVHALEDLDAVDVREHHVEDHERRGELGDRTQGAPAGRGGLDVESLVAEGHGYELGDVRFVVDHEHPGAILVHDDHADRISWGIAQRIVGISFDFSG